MRTKTPTTNISIRLDKELKAQADHALADAGLNYTTAFTMFLKQFICQGQPPVEVFISHNPVLLEAAVDEAESMIKSGNFGKSYQSVSAMLDDIENSESDDV